MSGLAGSGTAMVAGFSSDTLQTILQVLLGVSLLLTLRAILSQTWVTMWLAAALAMRRSRSPREWVMLLFAGVATFGLVVYGLAFLRLWDFWIVAFPLAFIAWSMPLRRVTLLDIAPSDAMHSLNDTVIPRACRSPDLRNDNQVRPPEGRQAAAIAAGSAHIRNAGLKE